MALTGDSPQRSTNRSPVEPAAMVLIGSTVVFSWPAMMAVHEFGHMLHAWLTGGTVTNVVLHPLAISRTDVEPNPHPLAVVWGGPIWGSLIPLVPAGVARVSKWPGWPIVVFFAGFCLIANGAYIGVGSWDAVGDALELLKLGTPRWALAVFGLCTIPLGFWLWHGLGRHFGIGQNRLPVRWRTALTMAVLSGLVVMLEFMFSDRM